MYVVGICRTGEARSVGVRVIALVAEPWSAPAHVCRQVKLSAAVCFRTVAILLHFQFTATFPYLHSIRFVRKRIILGCSIIKDDTVDMFTRSMN